MLAPRSSQSLVSSSGHANTGRFFPSCRRLYWRLAPGEALFLRPPTPTRAAFSPADGALVGALLPANPCFFIRSRQQVQFFPGLTAPLLAPCSRRSLVSPSANANMPRIFSGWRRLCWRLAPREALFLRPPTPTGARFSRADGAFVGALLPSKPLPFIRPRQQAAPNPFPGGRRPCWRLAPGHCLRRQPREPKSLHPISNLSLPTECRLIFSL